ncbi:MAG: TVP38/TMEM64 family protein [Desulfurivibrionaceae bacterium]
MTKLKVVVIILTVAAFLAAGLISLSKGQGFFAWFNFLVNRDTQPILFIFLMALMPIIGFPLSVFLILAGIKFGMVWGSLLTALTMIIHLTVSYLLAHSLFKPYLDRMLKNYRGHLRYFREKVSISHLFLFVVIPGLPYAVKNYTLSLSGLTFQAYFALGWTVQMVMALPLVILGSYAIRMNLTLALLILVFLMLLYLILNRLYRRLGADLKPSSPEEEGENNDET